jgi:hypothetical protein
MPDINGNPFRTDLKVTILQPDPKDKFYPYNGKSGVIVHVYPWGDHGMAVLRLNGRRQKSEYLLLDGNMLRITSTQKKLF